MSPCAVVIGEGVPDRPARHSSIFLPSHANAIAVSGVEFVTSQSGATFSHEERMLMAGRNVTSAIRPRKQSAWPGSLRSNAKPLSGPETSSVKPRARDRVDEADAFGQLIVQSQRTNTPLRLVAEELMDSLPTQ